MRAICRIQNQGTIGVSQGWLDNTVHDRGAYTIDRKWILHRQILHYTISPEMLTDLIKKPHVSNSPQTLHNQDIESHSSSPPQIPGRD